MQIAQTYLTAESRNELMAQTEARRIVSAKARPVDIVLDDRRVAKLPVSIERRRFHTMDDKLAAAAHVQAERRFTGAGVTGFGLFS